MSIGAYGVEIFGYVVGICVRDILWGYVLGICCRDMSQGYVVDIRCGDMLVAYVVGIRWLHRSMDTLQAYVTGIRCRHTLEAYVGCIGRGCTAVRVMSVGVMYLGVCRWGWVV